MAKSFGGLLELSAQERAILLQTGCIETNQVIKTPEIRNNAFLKIRLEKTSADNVFNVTLVDVHFDDSNNADEVYTTLLIKNAGHAEAMLNTMMCLAKLSTF
jgi:hypothetical protein